MTSPTAPINPFYAARHNRPAPAKHDEPGKPVYARLPLAPVTGSPVPHLTSLYHFHRAGEYGDRDYPGNCGGNLIKDLLLYFQPGLVFDPMTGSGTCRDVCEELGHSLHLLGHPPGLRRLRPEGFRRRRDLRLHLGPSALLAAEALCRRSPRPVAHPDAGGLPATLPAVHPQLRPIAEARRQAGHPDGRLLATARPGSSRWSTTRSDSPSRPGSSSTAPTSSASATAPAARKKVYRTSFIPGLHDVCMIFERP